MHSIPTISIRQPWALFVLAGIKTIGNRKWNTPHRGLLIIHSPKLFDEQWQNRVPSLHALDQATKFLSRTRMRRKGTLPPWYHCHAVGAVILSDCRTKQYHNPWAENHMFHHIYKRPSSFRTPWPLKGSQRIFQTPINAIPDEALQQLKEEYPECFAL